MEIHTSLLNGYLQINKNILMKKDATTTKVLFLMEQPDSDISANVFAFFPESLYSSATQLFECYAHIGQHSSCHKEYADKCLQATHEQYAALKNRIGGLRV